MQEIEGTHIQARTGQRYAYTARYDDSGKGLHIQLSIPIAARDETLVVERTIFFDPKVVDVATMVARFAANKIDETRFDTVEIG